jgi:hypothetical protein
MAEKRAREAEAISPTEAKVRLFFGYSSLATSAICYFLFGPQYFRPGAWCILVGTSMLSVPLPQKQKGNAIFLASSPLCAFPSLAQFKEPRVMYPSYVLPSSFFFAALLTVIRIWDHVS